MAIIRHAFPSTNPEKLTDDEFAKLYTEAIFIIELNNRFNENAMVKALAKVFAKT